MCEKAPQGAKDHRPCLFHALHGCARAAGDNPVGVCDWHWLQQMTPERRAWAARIGPERLLLQEEARYTVLRHRRRWWR